MIPSAREYATRGRRRSAEATATDTNGPAIYHDQRVVSGGPSKKSVSGVFRSHMNNDVKRTRFNRNFDSAPLTSTSPRSESERKTDHSETVVAVDENDPIHATTSNTATATAPATAPTTAVADSAPTPVRSQGRRLWLDVRAHSGLWYPAQIVGGPDRNRIQVQLQRAPPTNQLAALPDDEVGGRPGTLMWVDSPNVATAGTFAYYGTVETTAKPGQVLLAFRKNVRGVDDAWIEAQVLSRTPNGVLLLQPVGEDDGARFRVHATNAKRLRPLGPSQLPQLCKVPVDVTVQQFRLALKEQARRQRAPLRDTSSAVNNSRQAESKMSQARAAGAYHNMRASRRIVQSASAQHAHFQHSLQEAGMQLYPCEGDGNCLFRAIAHQLYVSTLFVFQTFRCRISSKHCIPVCLNLTLDTETRTSTR